MKTKSNNFFIWLALMIVAGLSIVACSQTDEMMEVAVEQPDENGMYHYPMKIDCAVPTFDDNGQTRAMVYNWENNQLLFVRFKNGSNWITGQAVYNANENIWDVGTYQTLPTVTGEEICEMYYFDGAVGTTSSTVTMNEKTACYMTKTAIYTHPSSNSISIRASLDKMTWRMRFKGTLGTSIILPSSGNDINYYTSFNQSTGSFTSAKKDIALTVNSNGYTPYIYGEFVNSGDNTITVSNNDGTFTRKLFASNLSVGESAYMDVPTASSYLGWTKNDIMVDSKATIQPDYLVTFTDGVAMDWKFGSAAYTCDFSALKKSYAETLTDDELANEIYTDPVSISNAKGAWLLSNMTPNTEYYLCAVAKNSSGTRGPVLRYLFKTNSENLPYAEVSNIQASSSSRWDWDITLKNNAKSYYIYYTINESDITKNWHFVAYYAHRDATSGESEMYDWESVYIDLSPEQCKYITICTWGVDASGNIGNPNVAYGSTSSRARNWGTANSSPTKQMMSKEEMQKMRSNVKIYRLER